MLLIKVTAIFGLLAGITAAVPTSPKTRRDYGHQSVIYWGQNGGGTIENNDLSTYCTPDSGIDIIILAFLYQFGNGNTIPSGTIGQSCSINNAGHADNCEALGAAISKCQSNGVTILLSLGGAVGAYSLTSSAEATSIGNYLWAAYGNSGRVTSVARPFGSAFVNGFDFDLERNAGNEFYADMIKALRANFQTDPTTKYYITGAPQCPIPEPNMGIVVESSQFDYLWPQFYNNNNYKVRPRLCPNQYPCALPVNGNAPFNFDNWLNYTSGTPSADAKVFIGVPAALLGANGSPSGETYYAEPRQLANIVAGVRQATRFGGIMMWAAGFSDSNVNDGCTFAQQARAILDTGSPCSNGPLMRASGSPIYTVTVMPTMSVSPAPTVLATPLTTPTPSAPPVPPEPASNGPVTNGTVPQWQQLTSRSQCGGFGYTGPTECEAPYKCVSVGEWWSHCA
ncbi:putative endochitinase CHI2 [Xylariaceae sp. FL0594]|nr:putative endochitinase CHI2 [Xylariaceae sp. FL0594]